VRSLIERELAGFDRWPVGRFVGVSAIELAWDGGEEAAAGGEARSGHLRASIEVELSRATLGLTLRLTPRVEGSELRFSATTRARVAMASRVAQWVVDLIDGDEIVAERADREIAGALDRLLTAPPPLELGGGRAVELVLRDGRQVEVVSDRHAAPWLAARLDRAAAAGARGGRAGGPRDRRRARPAAHRAAAARARRRPRGGARPVRRPPGRGGERSPRRAVAGGAARPGGGGRRARRAGRGPGPAPSRAGGR